MQGVSRNINASGRRERGLNKILILVVFFLIGCSDGYVSAEPVDKSKGEISNVLVTIYWFDTTSEMSAHVEEHFGQDPERLQGFSMIERYGDRDLCHMDMFVVRPNEVDDEHTLTIGHEILHCIYGKDYHDEVE